MKSNNKNNLLVTVLKCRNITGSGQLEVTSFFDGHIRIEKSLKIESFFGKRNTPFGLNAFVSYLVYGHDNLTNKRESPSKNTR